MAVQGWPRRISRGPAASSSALTRCGGGDADLGRGEVEGAAAVNGGEGGELGGVEHQQSFIRQRKINLIEAAAPCRSSENRVEARRSCSADENP